MLLQSQFVLAVIDPVRTAQPDTICLDHAIAACHLFLCLHIVHIRLCTCAYTTLSVIYCVPPAERRSLHSGDLASSTGEGGQPLIDIAEDLPDCLLQPCTASDVLEVSIPAFRMLVKARQPNSGLYLCAMWSQLHIFAVSCHESFCMACSVQCLC